MKDKSNRWPRSAKITVWVLGIIIAASTIVNIIAVTQWYGPYQKWIDYSTRYLPMEEPKGEDTPIIMPDIEELKKNPPDYEVFELF